MIGKAAILLITFIWLTVATSNQVFAIDPQPVSQRDFLIPPSSLLEQTVPDVAKSDDTGISIVVWRDPSIGIQARRYTRLGIETGTTITVTSNTAATQPHVASDAIGNFVVIWQTGDTAQDNIAAQRYNAAGIAQGAAISVTTGTDDEQLPDVAMDEDGNFVVVFERNNGANTSIVARRYTADGSFDSEVAVTSTAAPDEFAPSIAMNDDGNFVITYRHNDGGNISVIAQRYISPTVVSGNPITATVANNTTVEPDVGIADDGRFVLAWDDNDTVYAQPYNELGVAQGVSITVQTGDDTDPAIAVEPDGIFVVTWKSALAADSSIRAIRYSASGSILRDYNEVQVTTDDDHNDPVIAVDDYGDFMIAWNGQENSDDGNDVWARLFASPQLTITKSVTPTGVITSGNYLTYTVVVTNIGAYTATNVTISDTLLADMIVAQADIVLDPVSAGATIAVDTSGAAPIVAVNGIVITGGSAITVTIPVSLPTSNSYSGIFTNTAAVTSTQIVTPVTAQVPIAIGNLPAISINDVTVNEDAGIMTFTISLDQAAVADVQMTYATADNTALSGSDYTNSSSTIGISAGNTSTTLGIPILDDNIAESTETFFVNLSGATNAYFADAQGIGTILDDEGPVCIGINDVSAQESAGSIVFTVNLSVVSASNVTVNYATANGSAIAPANYTASSGTLTFTPGQQSQSIAIDIVNYPLAAQGNRTLVIQLSNASGGSICTATGTGTIVDTTPTSTPTGTPTPTATPTSTSTATATSTAIPTATSTQTPMPTNTSTPVPTVTPTVMPTVTPTMTPIVMPTVTPIPTETSAAAATSTPVSSATSVPASTTEPTATSVPATSVPATSVPPTITPTATVTPTTSPVPPTQVPPTLSPTPSPTATWPVVTDSITANVIYTGTVEEDSVTPGDVVHFILFYENVGSDTLTNVVINAFVPNETTFVEEESGLPSSVSAAGTMQQPDGTIWELVDGDACPTGHPTGAECLFRIGTLEPGTRGSLLYNARVDDDAQNGDIIVMDSLLHAENPAGNFLIDLVLDTENFKPVNILSNPIPTAPNIPINPDTPTALEEMPEPTLTRQLFLPWVSR